MTRSDEWVPRLDANIREHDGRARSAGARLPRVPRARLARARTCRLSSSSPACCPDREARVSIARLVYEQELATTVTAQASPAARSPGIVHHHRYRQGRRRSGAGRTRSSIESVSTTRTAGTRPRPSCSGPAAAFSPRFPAKPNGSAALAAASDILAESMTYDGTPDGLPLASGTYFARQRRRKCAPRAGAGSRRPHYTLVVKPFPSLQPRTLLTSILPSLGRAAGRHVPGGPARHPVEWPQSHPARAAHDAARQHDACRRCRLRRRHRGTRRCRLARARSSGRRHDDAGLRSRSRDDLDALGAQIATGSALDLSFVRLRRAARATCGRHSTSSPTSSSIPRFRQDMVDLAKRRRLAQIGQEKAQPVPRRRVFPGRSMERPCYGNPLTGSGFERTVTALTRADLVQWHRQWFHPNNATLIVAGDTIAGRCRSRTRARIQHVAARPGAGETDRAGGGAGAPGACT